MTSVRAITFVLLGIVVAAGCERRKPAAPTTAPATQASTKPTTKPKELTYVDIIRAAYPKVPATQPLGVPVDLQDAGKFILDVPVYLCPRGDLWITRADAPATDPVVWRASEDQIHLLREPVVFALWASDDDGKWFPRPVVRSSGGAFEWIDREGRRPTTAGRAYRWDAAMILNNGVAVPTDRGVSVFTFVPEYKEDYHALPAAPGANPPQIVLDSLGFIAWSPWDGIKPGGQGITRYADGKWTDIPPSDQWPEKILHLVPLLDGSVLQLIRETEKGPIKLAMSVMQTIEIDEKIIAALVEQLSDNDPEKRNAAYAELTRYGNSSWPILEKMLEDQSPETRIRLQELLRNRIQPTLGGRAPLDGVMQVADRFADGGIALYLPAGVRVPDPNDATKPPRVIKPAWISIRPGRAIELLDKVIVRQLPPEKQDLYAFGDEWVTSDDMQGPQRLYGNHLEPLLGKEEIAFRDVIGLDRRGRWLFRKPGDSGRTLLLDPTLPDPTPKLPIWLLPVSKGMVGWTKDNWPAVKGSATLVKNLDAWALHEKGWKPIDMTTDTIVIETPKTPVAAKPATTQPFGPPILIDKDGRSYYEGKELLVIIDKSGKQTKWPLPPNAVGSASKVWLTRTDDGLLFLFNQTGRVVRIKPTPGEAEPFAVEATFTKRVPNTDKIQRIWLDPAGRIVIMYEQNKLAILFPTGRVPRDIAMMIPAQELQ
ncbi:MAG: hypothetical protein QOF78_159 [Phycisphaerales bacterium]|jgi:hypothetical protein|nr:hypothetical protein [Phycisphaerales bacterium]